MDSAAPHGLSAARPTRLWAAIVAATVMGLPLGSIYAFSIFLQPLETALATSRSTLTLIFSLAAVAFTFGMYAAPRFYGHLSGAWLVVVLSAATGIGIAWSALARSPVELAIAYGLLFGGGGGAAFNVTQQCVNLLVRTRQGLVNGYLVSLFPAGAMIAAPLCGAAIVWWGHKTALLLLAVTLVICGAVSAVLLWVSGARIEQSARAHVADAATTRLTPEFIKLFLVFFLAAAAGLMVLSQSAGIIATYGGAAALALGGTTAITAAIACARIAGGWLVDRFPIPYVSAAAQALALCGAALLTILPTPVTAVLALMLIGMGYGFISGVTAGAIAFYWPRNAYGWITGRLYFAWCLAAVTLPVLAAFLFDLTGGYAAAMIVAGGGNLVGIVVALTLPAQGQRRQ